MEQLPVLSYRELERRLERELERRGIPIPPREGEMTNEEVEVTPTDEVALTKVGLIPNCKLVCQGAEGRVFETKYWKKSAIVKQRFNKMYRHPILNAKLTRQRLGMEVKGMLKARKLGIRTPTVYLVDQETNSIVMEKMGGVTVKDWLRAEKYTAAELEEVLSRIGKQVAALHDGGLVHGDLTTSNMMIQEGSLDLTFIDFGLSYNPSAQNGPEDKGVDLYVMERAFLNAHADKPGLFDKVLSAYSGATNRWAQTFNRFSDVRMRGRKRSMVG